MRMYQRPEWAQMFPEGRGFSMLLAAGISGGAGLLAVLLGTTVLQDYGLALFVGVPLVMGFVAPLVHGMGGRRSFSDMLGANALSQFVLFFFMIGLGREGLGCLIMCAPLWSFVALLGTLAAYPIHAAQWNGHVNACGFPVMGLLVVLSMPLWMGAEHMARPESDVWAVTTTVEIDAPPGVVWESVVSFPELPEPTDWVFYLGVAYPKHAIIEGRGVGAVRYCVFSTGAFVEPITVWEEGKLLAFDVVESPPSMREMSPYEIHPAHLEGYLMSQHGQFRLIDLGNGRTRLEGTTWYRNQMFPAAYWRLWSDTIIHRIHLRVLNHVKALSESDARKEVGP